MSPGATRNVERVFAGFALLSVILPITCGAALLKGQYVAAIILGAAAAASLAATVLCCAIQRR